MAWPKGKPRPVSSGRKKGTPNKKSEALLDVCERLNLNPFEAMAQIALDHSQEPGLRFNALKEICQYVYPKRKAIEHSGEINNPYADKTYEELKDLVLEKLKDG